ADAPGGEASGVVVAGSLVRFAAPVAAGLVRGAAEGRGAVLALAGGAVADLAIGTGAAVAAVGERGGSDAGAVAADLTVAAVGGRGALLGAAEPGAEAGGRSGAIRAAR